MVKIKKHHLKSNASRRLRSVMRQSKKYKPKFSPLNHTSLSLRKVTKIWQGLPAQVVKEKAHPDTFK